MKTTRCDAGTSNACDVSCIDVQVALVSMPFASIMRPSIQLGLLKAIAQSHGFSCTCLHLDLDFAATIGPAVFEHICQQGRSFIGDWLFSEAAFENACPDPNGEYLDTQRAVISEMIRDVGSPIDFLLEVRNKLVPRYLNSIVHSTQWNKFTVVGFTSTFQQNVASLALARRLKEATPSLLIVFGGSNCDGDMGQELLQKTWYVDYVVQGEGDIAFPSLLMAIQNAKDPSLIPGVLGRTRINMQPDAPAPKVSDLDSSPTPIYDEFFERAESLGILTAGERRKISLPIETARGCWWGEKKHCVFCGLNGTNMNFRSKSATRVHHEMAELSKRYRTFNFEAVDNILDPTYLKDVFPRFIEDHITYEMFYEVKSNLSREQIKLLYQAGLRRIQPGIESLSSRVLRLMRKGVTAIQNINTLKWATYYGISVGWNLLYGFSGEVIDDYIKQAKVLRSLKHLQPPHGVGRIWMERFSPLFFDRSSFPLRRLVPQASYSYIYPKDYDLNNLAYFFEYDLEGGLPDETYRETDEIVDSWKQAWCAETTPQLRYWYSPDFLQVEDYRSPLSPEIHTFAEPLAAMYVNACDRPISASKLSDKLLLPWPLPEVKDALHEFCDRGLMVSDEEMFLGLAMPAAKGR